MDNYKEETIRSYNKTAEEYEAGTKGYLEKFLWKEANLFANSLNGDLVLDLGCGPGRDLMFFRKNWLRCVGIDLSIQEIKLCKSKNLEVCVMDLEELGFKEKVFDGIWAYTSLLHLPKEKLRGVLEVLSNLLKEDGVFFIGMRKGNYEGYQENPRAPETKRFISLYSDQELRERLSKRFQIKFYSETRPDEKRVYLNYLCKKA